MTAKYLRACIAAYLRYVRKCPIVSFERGLYGGILDLPDVLAVTETRRLIEVEIKVSLPDFRADSKKRKWSWASYMTPRQHYYCVPVELLETVKAERRPESGVMSIGRENGYGLHDVYIAAKAAIPEAGKLPMRKMIEMVRNQSGTLCGLAREVALGSARVEQHEGAALA